MRDILVKRKGANERCDFNQIDGILDMEGFPNI